MSEITEEIYTSLPESVAGQFEKQGDVYVSIDSLKLTALKSKLDSAYNERDQIKGKLTAQEQATAEKIAAADAAAYERAVKENDFESQNKILKEKLADADKRKGETELKYQERLQAIATDKKNMLVSEISQLAVGSKRAAMNRLLKDYLDVDPETGAESFLNDDGSASSLTKEQFIASLADNDVFKSLIEANVGTRGGGLSNGSLSTSSAGLSRSKMSSDDKAEYIKKHGQESYLKLKK